MASTTMLEHIQSPRNRGAMEKPDGQSQQENQVCGDRLEVWLRISSNTIECMSWRGEGCAAALAAASATSELVVGMTLDEASHLDADHIRAALEGLPPRKGHAAALAATGVRAAVADYRARCTMLS